MTDATEPTVRYWRHNESGDLIKSSSTWRAAHYEGSPNLTEVFMHSDAELDAIKAEVAESIARRIETVDPIDWALAGQHAGLDAARIARTPDPNGDTP